MKLTEHFTLEEFTDSQTAARKGIDNVPAEGSAERKNLQRLAETMERVRSVLGGKPILISSGYRSPAVNAAVGGSKSSVHMRGLAADFTCPGYGTPLRICQELRVVIDALAIDQLIHEYGTWVHLGLSEGKPRYMVMTIDNKGARQGL